MKAFELVLSQHSERGVPAPRVVVEVTPRLYRTFSSSSHRMSTLEVLEPEKGP